MFIFVPFSDHFRLPVIDDRYFQTLECADAAGLLIVLKFSCRFRAPISTKRSDSNYYYQCNTSFF